jgi:hypothetical protein
MQRSHETRLNRRRQQQQRRLCMNVTNTLLNWISLILKVYMTSVFSIAYASPSSSSSSSSPSPPQPELSELHDSNKQTNSSLDFVDIKGYENNSTSLFNNHELIGITITSIYFIFGFPTNLLSIIICFRSLFSQNRCRFWFLKSFRQMRQRKRSESFYQPAAAGGSPATQQTNNKNQTRPNKDNRINNNNKYKLVINKKNMSDKDLIGDSRHKRSDEILFNRQMNAISFLPLMNKRRLFAGKTGNFNLKVNFNSSSDGQNSNATANSDCGKKAAAAAAA